MDRLQKKFDEIAEKAWDLRKQESYEEAIKLIMPFAEKGLPIAQHCIATFYYYGEGVNEDFNKASEWLQKSADQDFCESLCMLGHQNLYGVGIPRNISKGIDLLVRAVNKSNGYACYLLGKHYQFDRVKCDYFRASGYYVMGVNLDNKDCMRARADMHFSAKEYKDALNLYIRASQLGCVKSTFNAATIFEKGLGYEVDLKLAFLLYKSASEAGDFMALHNLGTFYYSGKYVEKDKEKAFNCYLKAANEGVALSQHCIGLMYLNGDICQDLDVSLAWFNKALERGCRDSEQYINEIKLIKNRDFIEH